MKLEKHHTREKNINFFAGISDERWGACSAQGNRAYRRMWFSSSVLAVRLVAWLLSTTKVACSPWMWNFKKLNTLRKEILVHCNPQEMFCDHTTNDTYPNNCILGNAIQNLLQTPQATLNHAEDDLLHAILFHLGLLLDVLDHCSNELNHGNNEGPECNCSQVISDNSTRHTLNALLDGF